MFSRLCFNCGIKSYNSYPICNKCSPKVLKKELVCSVCGIPTSAFVKTCPSCTESNYSFINNYSLFLYSGINKEVLNQYKFKKDISIANFYVKHITSYIKNNFSTITICPVPTSTLKRKIKNGYQLDLIIKGLKKNGFTVSNMLVKKYSKTQKKLGKKERVINLKNSFKINKKNILHNSDVLLLDDVFTTGATINECAKKLEKYSNTIYALTLCRD